MRELIRTNDMIVLSFATSCLEGGGIDVIVADQHMAGLEGAIGAFPRRLAVAEEHWRRARQILIDAGLADQLLDEGESR